MSDKMRRHLSLSVEELCRRLCTGPGTENAFKKGLSNLEREYDYLGEVRFQAIGNALQRAAVAFCKDRIDYVWGLANQLDPRIRQGFEQAGKRMPEAREEV